MIFIFVILPIIVCRECPGHQVLIVELPVLTDRSFRFFQIVLQTRRGVKKDLAKISGVLLVRGVGEQCGNSHPSPRALGGSREGPWMES